MSTSSRVLGARTLAILSLLLAAVLATGHGAYAASRTVTDTTDDTYKLTDTDAVRTPGQVGDIVSVRTTHNNRAVVIAVRVRELPSGVNAGLFEIKTSNPGKPYFLLGVAGPGTKSVQLSKGVNGRALKCRGALVGFKIADDVVQAQVPRSCIGDPRWVRTGALIESTTLADVQSGNVDTSGISMDVAGLDSLDGFLRAGGNSLPLSPKVKRG